MGVGEQRRSAQIERAPAPPPREPRQITITEGVTVRDLAEKLDVRAKDVLKILLDRGICASINQALDTPTATRYLHLARVCEMAGDADGAAAALKEAKALGLRRAQLHPVELATFTKLLEGVD